LEQLPIVFVAGDFNLCLDGRDVGVQFLSPDSVCFNLEIKLKAYFADPN
jgi:hypothetical protein